MLDLIEENAYISISKMSLPLTVYLRNYGCQMNLYDGELVSGLLTREGFALTANPEEAQVILINTCGVRDHAERRVLGRLHALSALKQRRPDLLIGVLGCMAQRWGEDLKAQVPSVDLILGPDAYRQLPTLIRDKLFSENGDLIYAQGAAGETYGNVTPQRSEGVNAFVAIMRGCDNFCSYCIVPYVRGRERSRPPEEIVAEVEAAVRNGYPEVTLLGQNVNSYRWGELDFAGLLDQLKSVSGLLRLRFLTSHPRDLSTRLIERLAAGGVICPSLHLPVQSGSDRILELMGRGYIRQQYLEKVEKLRQAVPDLALTTDLLCGFPSEGEAEFQQTLELMEQAQFDDAFTFKYSERPGTAAALLPDDVPEKVKIERLERMIAKARFWAEASRRRLLGQELEVLLERPSPKDHTEWSGRTRCGRMCLTPGAYKPAQLVRIRVAEVRGFSLWGQQVNKPVSVA